jgi:HPt (histidine-containing phosphotransfer) domain-containing protein
MQRSAESPRKALVVEEDAHERDLGVAVLTQLDYRVETAVSAAEALTWLGRERFALVLLSSTLADLAAERARLRRLAAPIALPLVLVHAAGQTPDLLLAEVGAIGRLSRPLSGEAIRRLVEAEQASREPIIDMDHLLSFTDGDLELEGELSVLFLSSAEAYFEKMSRAVRTATPWFSSAHALKGASANLGARRLAALARRAEQQQPAAEDLRLIRRAIDEVSAFFDERQRVHSRSDR